MASSRIKGIQIEIGGTTDKLGKALEGVEKTTRSLQSELRGVNSLLKVDPSNVELLTQKQQILNEAIDDTKEKLKILENAQAQVQEQFEKGDITIEQYRDFQREIIVTKQKLESLEDEQKNFGSVVEQQMKVAGTKVKEFGSKVQTVGKDISEMGEKFAPVSAGATAAIGVSIASATSLEGAVNKYLGATGKSIDETERFRNVLQKIHDGGYGESYGDIAEKMRIVSNILGDLPDEELQNVVEKSFMLEETFGMDFQETLRGVNNLMYQYGLSSEEAFDLFTKGAQEGLNYTDELGDNVSEYVGNFKQAGYSADEYFQLLKNGSENGAYNLDKVNDAINEVKNRLGDGTIEKNLTLFSSETQKVFKEWQKGDASMKDVIDRIVQDIKECTNEQEALTMAATAFGTMGEDSNLDFVKSLTSVGDTFKDVSNTAEKTGETIYGGTGSKINKTIREIKSTMADLGKTLLPIINDILKKIQNLIKRFNSLDDGTKDMIVSVGLLVAAISPLLMLIGTATNGIGLLVKGVGNMIEFGGRMTTALKKMTVAQNANNLAVLANPYVAAAAAIAGLVAGIVIWMNKTDEKTKQMQEETEKVKEQTQAVQEEANAYRDSVQARQESLNQSLAELDYYDTLYNELQSIVDQNGKVKEGYEARADFITTTLSQALGFEVSLVGDQIQGYNELVQTFDEVMEKKKAMLILESQEEAYTTALKNREDELRKAHEAEMNMQQAKLEAEKLFNESREQFWAWDRKRLQEQTKEKWKQYEEYKTQYDTHQSTYQSYLNTIGMYEGNYQAMHDEKYNEMMLTEQDYLVKQAENGQLSIENIKKMITETQNNLEYLKNLKKQNNTDIYNEDIAAQEAQLQSLQNSLTQQQIAVNVGNSNITNEWLTGIANQLTAITGKQYEFKKKGDGTVQMYIDGVKSKKPVAEKDMEKFANEMISKVNKKSQAKKAGEDVIEGVNQGVRNEKKQSNVFSAIWEFGGKLLNNLKNALKERSPSKATEEMGEFLDEGIIVGIENKKKEALRTAMKFGGDVLSKMRDSLNGDINTPDFNKNMLLEVGTNFTNSKYQQQQTSKISDLINVLNTYMPEIISKMGQDIILDDNTLVGRIAPKMDTALGSINAKKTRDY